MERFDRKGSVRPSPIGDDAGPQAISHQPVVQTLEKIAENAVRRGAIVAPPYSPDFNPIEMAVSKVRTFPEKMAARAIDHLWNAIAEAIGPFAPTECENDFKAAGLECQ